MRSPFTQSVIDAIRSIPEGKVSSYGAVAALAGSPRAARQVVRILHSTSEQEQLPWHRVVNKAGEISLPRGDGFEEQQALLMDEGVRFDQSGRVLPEFWSG